MYIPTWKMQSKNSDVTYLVLVVANLCLLYIHVLSGCSESGLGGDWYM